MHNDFDWYINFLQDNGLFNSPNNGKIVHMSASLWTVVLGWPLVGIIVVLLIGTGVGVLSMSPAQYTIAQVSFALASLILISRTGWWLAFEQPPDVGTLHVGVFAFFGFGFIGILYVQSARWINGLRETALQRARQTTTAAESSPNERPPTMLSLFRSDFPNVMKLLIFA